MTKETRKIGKASRTEPCIDVSEFTLSKPSATKPILLTNLTKNLGKRKDFKKTDESVKKIARKIQPLAKPLEAAEAQRVRRSEGYKDVKHDLNEWDAVVTANRAKTTISFPLNYHNYKSENLIDFLEKTNDSSETEHEDKHKSQDEKTNQTIRLKLNKEQMLQRVRQIAKIRAQQSYEMKKNRYQNKIKGRKFRKILRKSKLAKQLSEFEKLKEKDAEKALEMLDDLERVRAKERATLRHRSVGKWAKHMQTRAKYNAESREELANVLALSRELTEKHAIDDEASDSEIGSGSGSGSGSDSDSESDSESGCRQQKKESKARKRLAVESDNEDFFDTPSEVRASGSSAPFSAPREPKLVSVARRSKEASVGNGKVKSACEKAEKVVKDVKKIIGRLEKDIKSSEKQRKKVTKERKKSASRASDLSFPDRVRFADEEGLSELMETTENDIDRIEAHVESATLAETAAADKSRRQRLQLNDSCPEQHAHAKISSTPATLEQLLDSSAVENGEDYNDSDCSEDEDLETKEINQMESANDELYLEANADEDLLVDFEKEKKKEIEDSVAPDVDLALPGWGSWVGGKQHSFEKCRKRKRRFVIAMPKAEKRRDENKGFLIVNEDLDEAKIKEHQVSDLPYPFKKVKTFEDSIQKPIGNTFVPELEHLKLTKPKVITKMGAIIDPICKKDLRK